MSAGLQVDTERCETEAVRPQRHVASVNVGEPRAVRAKLGSSGIDKRPVAGSIRVMAPLAGRSGVDGDTVCDLENHGGPSQAVYAYAREDLDWWETSFGRTLSNGTFGENLTTVGVDVTAARLGEQWQIGDVVLAVTGPRIPCATFAVWMNERGWLKAFTERARPGAYLRVVAPGQLRAGDEIVLVDRPEHSVDIGLCFRALTSERELMPRLLEAGDDLELELRDLVVARGGVDSPGERGAEPADEPAS